MWDQVSGLTPKGLKRMVVSIVDADGERFIISHTAAAPAECDESLMLTAFDDAHLWRSYSLKSDIPKWSPSASPQPHLQQDTTACTNQRLFIGRLPLRGHWTAAMLLRCAPACGTIKFDRAHWERPAVSTGAGWLFALWGSAPPPCSRRCRSSHRKGGGRRLGGMT